MIGTAFLSSLLIGTIPTFAFVETLWKVVTLKGCDHWNHIRSIRSDTQFDYCYEDKTSNDKTRAFTVYDLRKRPNWKGLYDSSTYLLIVNTQIVTGFGRFVGNGNIMGFVENKNTGKRYTVMCFGKQSTGKKYGYCNRQ